MGRFRDALLWCTVLVTACSNGTSPLEPRPDSPGGAAVEQVLAASPARVVLTPPGQDPVEVDVELAIEPEERTRGLMFRKHLGADDGMLFLFEREEPLSFWMRNTYVPLDMVFIRSDLTVLGVVENAEPETEVPRRVPGNSQYVLEVNAGFARQHGIVAGVPVRFDGVPGF